MKYCRGCKDYYENGYRTCPFCGALLVYIGENFEFEDKTHPFDHGDDEGYELDGSD